MQTHLLNVKRKNGRRRQVPTVCTNRGIKLIRGSLALFMAAEPLLTNEPTGCGNTTKSSITSSVLPGPNSGRTLRFPPTGTTNCYPTVWAEWAAASDELQELERADLKSIPSEKPQTDKSRFTHVMMLQLWLLVTDEAGAIIIIRK